MSKRSCIMVVDDDFEMLRLIERAFKLEGYDVIAAKDGSSALLLLRDCEPDLVILDIMMPGSDGFQVLNSIRQYSNIPVVMLTAKCEVMSKEKALNLGADDYIGKPFRPSELVACVQAMLRRSDVAIGNKAPS